LRGITAGSLKCAAESTVSKESTVAGSTTVTLTDEVEVPKASVTESWKVSTEPGAIPPVL